VQKETGMKKNSSASNTRKRSTPISETGVLSRDREEAGSGTVQHSIPGHSTENRSMALSTPNSTKPNSPTDAAYL
jgi:hypothetical protein